MNIETKKINNIKVVIANTDKFKSTCGVICFKSLIKENILEKRHMINNLLINTTKKFPTNRLLNINCLENYDSYYSSNVRMDGNYITNSFLFRCLDEEYSEKDLLDKVLDTFYEIIFNPNCNNNKFDEEQYNLVYQSLKERILTIKERASEYASNMFFKQIGDGTNASICFDIDSFNKITNENLYEEYKNMINNSEVSLFLAGKSIDISKFEKILNNIKSQEINEELFIETKMNYPFNEQIEDYKGNQSILKVAIKLKDLTNFEKTYVVPIFNNILGAGASSRLFDEVREKNSLCYSCFSRYIKDCSIISITSGIDKKNYEKTLNLIKEVINSMKNIEEEEINNAIVDISSALKESLDELSNYTFPLYMQDIYKEKRIDDKLKEIKKVTKIDVENLFNKVYITDSYFLKAGNKDE